MLLALYKLIYSFTLNLPTYNKNLVAYFLIILFVICYLAKEIIQFTKAVNVSLKVSVGLS